MLPFPLADVLRVEFYKRDELTTDLICCDVVTATGTWFWHEEAAEWPHVVAELATLPNFVTNWFEAVSQPAFAPSRTVAFSR